MDFRILGPLEVRDGERILSLGGTKRRAVLALLLLDANRVVAVDQLVDGLWGASPPPSRSPRSRITWRGSGASSAIGSSGAHPVICCASPTASSISTASGGSSTTGTSRTRWHSGAVRRSQTWQANRSGAPPPTWR